MAQELKIISLSMPFKLGRVNSYLVDTGSGIILIDNTQKPVLNAIMDDLEAAHASLEKLSQFTIHTVYPGHGKPFPKEEFTKAQ